MWVADNNKNDERKAYSLSYTAYGQVLHVSKLFVSLGQTQPMLKHHSGTKQQKI
jgi:hypothetical protein